MTQPSPPPPPPDAPAAPRRRWARRVVVGFLIVANVAIFGGLAALWWAARQVTTSVSTIPAGDLSLTEKPADLGEPRTFLLIGSDSRADLPDDFENMGDFGGQRADVIMLVQLLPDENRLQMLSIPRDLKVTLPSGPNRINAAFNDGAAAIVDAVGAATGLPIHHYLQVDFAGFAGIVDAMGGIQMTFPFPARDSKSHLEVGAGVQVLDGKTALALARSRSYQELRDGRWVSVDANDIGRTRRQQDLLMAMLAQLDRPSSIGGFGELVDALGGFVTTDDALGEDDIIQLAWEMRSIDPAEVEAVTLPVRDLEENGVWYVTEVQPAAGEVIAAFAGGEPLTQAADRPTRVVVQNGNGRAGSASVVGDSLSAAGFEVVSVGNSGREDYATTRVLARPVDLDRAQQVVDALGYGTAAVGRPPTEADVVVIVGFDGPSG